MTHEDSRRIWTEQLPPGQFRHLFDHLPGTLFFAKDRDGRLMAGNPAFVKRCGFQTEEEIIGLTDGAIFSPRLADKYQRDDEEVISSGKPLLGIIELFPNQEGKPEWFITDKLPLFNKAGNICGLCGTVRSYEAQRAAMQPYLELATVADHLKIHFREKLDVPALARMAHMSVRQFERKFRATFQMTPQEYMIRMRVIEACDLLVRTNQPVTTVALEAGFYDHSDFARQFRRHMGQTASQYRLERRQEMPVQPLATR
ncbi:MAG: AraC family transcriptional regulator [Verrucomicrobiaceae bacterium]|nr:MAG: AraC family transcriptional regulator [Verrucomicrobiaceae bacterium]